MSHPSSCMLVNHGPSQQSLVNEVLRQDTTHLIQRLCYQPGSPCQNPAGNWTTWRPPGHCKETQTAVVYVSCSSGLAKTILQGTVKGGRRQGRQKKRWEDNIREWTGLEFAKSQRAMENRGNVRKLVAKSSVAPQQPSRLRDRCWWWWQRECSFSRNANLFLLHLPHSASPWGILESLDSRARSALAVRQEPKWTLKSMSTVKIRNRKKAGQTAWPKAELEESLNFLAKAENKVEEHQVAYF